MVDRRDVNVKAKVKVKVKVKLKLKLKGRGARGEGSKSPNLGTSPLPLSPSPSIPTSGLFVFWERCERLAWVGPHIVKPYRHEDATLSSNLHGVVAVSFLLSNDDDVRSSVT